MKLTIPPLFALSLSRADHTFLVLEYSRSKQAFSMDPQVPMFNPFFFFHGLDSSLSCIFCYVFYQTQRKTPSVTKKNALNSQFVVFSPHAGESWIPKNKDHTLICIARGSHHIHPQAAGEFESMGKAVCRYLKSGLCDLHQMPLFLYMHFMPPLEMPLQFLAYLYLFLDILPRDVCSPLSAESQLRMKDLEEERKMGTELRANLQVAQEQLLRENDELKARTKKLQEGEREPLKCSLFRISLNTSSHCIREQ